MKDTRFVYNLEAEDLLCLPIRNFWSTFQVGYQKFRASRWNVSDFPITLIIFSQLLTLKILRNK